jgi:ELWxxDGT repeat protein
VIGRVVPVGAGPRLMAFDPDGGSVVLTTEAWVEQFALDRAPLESFYAFDGRLYRFVGVRLPGGCCTEWFVFRTDGTPEETRLLDVFPQYFRPFGGDVAQAGRQLYLAGYTPDEGEELWRVDLLSEQAVRVSTLQPGDGRSDIEHLTRVGGQVFFEAPDGLGRKQVWAARAGVRGDVDCDGQVTMHDIDPFVTLLVEPGAFEARGGCGRVFGDVNGDGRVDFFDIDPFVELLVGS